MKIKILIGLALGYIILTLMYNRSNATEEYTVVGESMSPTYKDGDKVEIRKKNSYNYNEVIVFVPSADKELGVTIKRIIAVAGDTVKVQDGDLYVNSELKYQNDNEAQSNYVYYDECFELKENQYFVVGDNYNDSCDSRSYGVINKKDIIGYVRSELNDKS